MALLDNAAQLNTIMPSYVCEHSLEMGPITDLMGSKVTCVGLGNAYTRPLGLCSDPGSGRWSLGL